MLQWLKQNRADNFEVKFNSEVNEFYYDTKTGVVSAVKILGKRGSAIECDAVVMCTGGITARTISSLLGARVPILPLKSISFDMPCKYVETAWVFEDKHFTVVPLTGAKTGLMRVQGHGDLVGFEQSFD